MSEPECWFSHDAAQLCMTLTLKRENNLFAFWKIKVHERSLISAFVVWTVCAAL